jgi:hypothetical protein
MVELLSVLDKCVRSDTGVFTLTQACAKQRVAVDEVKDGAALWPNTKRSFKRITTKVRAKIQSRILKGELRLGTAAQAVAELELKEAQLQAMQDKEDERTGDVHVNVVVFAGEAAIPAIAEESDGSSEPTMPE